MLLCLKNTLLFCLNRYALQVTKRSAIMKITLFFYIKNDSFPCVIEKLYLTLPTIICVNVYNVCSLLIRLYILMFV